MKLYKLFFTILLGFFVSTVMFTEINAQNIILSSQAEVNTFGATNPTSIPGFLLIAGADITDLTPLSTLTSIGGHLDITFNAALTSLNGLSSLTSIGNTLQVNGNVVLTDLNGLSSLTSVGADLIVSNNPALTNIDGLSSLTSFGGYLTISNNDALTNLDGLSNFTSVTGLQVESNDALTNLDGLSSLIFVDTYVALLSNVVLTNLDGLSSLTSIGWYLLVEDNPLLENIDGLHSLTTLGVHFGITLHLKNNSSLDSFCGLYPFFSSGSTVIGSIDISGNLINPTPQQIIDDGPCSATELIEDLIASVNSSDLPNGIKKSLTSSLDNTLKSLGKGNNGVAINQLEAFINKVEAQRGKKIDEATADEWIADAQAIIDLIQSGLEKKNGGESLATTDVKPDTYNLSQNYPNPFNPSTIIRYAVPEDARVTLTIYDVLGKQLAELVNGDVAAGYHEVTFDGSNLASGIYFYRITAGSFTQINKMLLIK